jgi:hypothetical protein
MTSFKNSMRAMGLLFSVAVMPGGVHAQTAAAPVQTATPAPSPTADVASGQTAAPAQSAAPAAAPVQAAAALQTPAPAAECVPSCRSGYLCHLGQCVSQCNPPCASGEQCRSGECYAAPVTAPAPEPQVPDPGAETHDGFMLRFTTGIGYAAAAASAESDDYTFGGASGAFAFDIGGAIGENLVLHGRFSDIPMIDPIVYLDGNEVREIDDANGVGVLLGPALTYYFMPANVYLTAAIGLSWLARGFERTDEVTSTGVGFGTNLDVGKEWWVSDNWGLGLAARFWYSHVSDRNVENRDVTYNLFGGSILFSATYN